MPENNIQEIGMTQMETSNKITCIIVNHNTAHLAKTAISTFRKFYSIHIVLIDNASQPDCVEELEDLQQEFNNITLIKNTENVGHGPAMHQAILLAETPYIFTLDSDTETFKCVFLEKMLLKFDEQENLYAIGWQRHVNANGISGDYSINKNLTPYIHPYAMLIERAKYLTLPQFANTGAPCTLNMQMAYQVGYTFYDFPIDKYIKHLIAGTRRLYKGRWNPGNSQIGKWKKDAKYRI